MSNPGTTSIVLRSLSHLRPAPKRSKFANRNSTKVQTNPKYVQPTDRIAYWNVVPGDYVKLRTGRVGHDQGLQDEKKVRGEGIVASIDRQRNLLWLRDPDDKTNLAPKAIKHLPPRYLDPDDLSKGFSPNVMEVAKPVHYSNVMLKVPGTDNYAVRLSKSKARFNKSRGCFEWNRFAHVRLSAEKAQVTGKLYEKIQVPWPTFPKKKQDLKPSEHAQNAMVKQETWKAWQPEDPVLLSEPKAGVSIESLRRHEIELQAYLNQHKENPLFQKKYHTKNIDGIDGTYVGFIQKRRIKPPPVPQLPTPSEHVEAQKKSLSQWVTSEWIKTHHKQRRFTFTFKDYLDLTPKFGSHFNGIWINPSSSLKTSNHDGQGSVGLSNRRNPKTGKLIHGISQNDLHQMPIELLMKDDLVNEKGLKWRMRKWKQTQIDNKIQKLEKEKQDKLLLDELKVLKV